MSVLHLFGSRPRKRLASGDETPYTRLFQAFIPEGHSRLPGILDLNVATYKKRVWPVHRWTLTPLTSVEISEYQLCEEFVRGAPKGFAAMAYPSKESPNFLALCNTYRNVKVNRPMRWWPLIFGGIPPPYPYFFVGHNERMEDVVVPDIPFVASPLASGTFAELSGSLKPSEVLNVAKEFLIMCLDLKESGMALRTDKLSLQDLLYYRSEGAPSANPPVMLLGNLTLFVMFMPEAENEALKTCAHMIVELFSGSANNSLKSEKDVDFAVSNNLNLAHVVKCLLSFYGSIPLQAALDMVRTAEQALDGPPVQKGGSCTSVAPVEHPPFPEEKEMMHRNAFPEKAPKQMEESLPPLVQRAKKVARGVLRYTQDPAFREGVGRKLEEVKKEEHRRKHGRSPSPPPRGAAY